MTIKIVPLSECGTCLDIRDNHNYNENLIQIHQNKLYDEFKLNCDVRTNIGLNFLKNFPVEAIFEEHFAFISRGTYCPTWLGKIALYSSRLNYEWWPITMEILQKIYKNLDENPIAWQLFINNISDKKIQEILNRKPNK